ncbi:MAG TPA: heavy metal translocating P-type ATPase, partial [Ruminococcaceae bacterium]|nr:heavy metal translocating P-type ATPase [Oscillospiraceae bacterium]
MKCTILHESKGRMRVRMAQKHMSLSQADILEAYLKGTDGVTDVKVHDLTCDAVIFYKNDRAEIISALASLGYD